MTWVCEIVENHNKAKNPGNMWQSDNGQWLILLPNGGTHNIHGLSESGEPWQVTGTPPNLTANPSISSKGWHGWLQNGVLVTD